MVANSRVILTAEYSVLLVVAVIAAIYLRSIRQVFSTKVYSVRWNLLLAMSVFGALRIVMMVLELQSSLNEEEINSSPLHTARQFLFAIGYWIFFLVRFMLVLVWLEATQKTKVSQFPREKIFTVVAIVSAIPLLLFSILTPIHPSIAFTGTSALLLIYSLGAIFIFIIAAIRLRVSLKSIQYKSQLPKIARRAQRVASTLAGISIFSYAFRAISNLLFAIDYNYFYDSSFIDMRMALYTCAEVLPALAMIGYVAYTSFRQKQQMDEFSSSRYSKKINNSKDKRSSRYRDLELSARSSTPITSVDESSSDNTIINNSTASYGNTKNLNNSSDGGGGSFNVFPSVARAEELGGGERRKSKTIPLLEEAGEEDGANGLKILKDSFKGEDVEKSEQPTTVINNERSPSASPRPPCLEQSETGEKEGEE